MEYLCGWLVWCFKLNVWPGADGLPLPRKFKLASLLYFMYGFQHAGQEEPLGAPFPPSPVKLLVQVRQPQLNL